MLLVDCGSTAFGTPSLLLLVVLHSTVFAGDNKKGLLLEMSKLWILMTNDKERHALNPILIQDSW